MDFKEATDRLTNETGLTLARVAEEFSVTPNSLSRMRTGTGTGTNALRPPAGWAAVVAKLAQEHAEAMEERAADLRGLADELRSVQTQA